MAQIGYNNNVRYRDRAFHIQTEDSGARTSSIVTHLFVDGGRILHTMKTSYADRAGEADLIDVIKAMMKAQHKAMFAALRNGQFDAELGESAAIPARPSQMPPASIEPIETVRSERPSVPVGSSGPVTLRSEPPAPEVASPRARDTLVVHPPSASSEEPPPDTARAPVAPSDTLRPVPPPVSLSVPAAAPPPPVPRMGPVRTSYRSVNPPQAISERVSRRLTAAELARLPPENGRASTREERTERAAIFRSRSDTPIAAEATEAFDDVILAFLSS